LTRRLFALSGNVRPCSGLRHGLVAAALTELVWQDRLRGDSRLLTLVDSRLTGDTTLDPILRAMVGHGSVNSVRSWILHLAGDVYDIDSRLLATLERDGVLRKEPRRMLAAIPLDCYPLHTQGVQVELRAAVRQAVRFVPVPDEPMLALIGLLCACELLGAVFSRGEAWGLRKRLSQLRPSNTTSRLIIETVDQLIRDSEGLAYIIGIG
jgi:Golgi phosphoprotein 3 (GPP34)